METLMHINLCVVMFGSSITSKPTEKNDTNSKIYLSLINKQLSITSKMALQKVFCFISFLCFISSHISCIYKARLPLCKKKTFIIFYSHLSFILKQPKQSASNNNLKKKKKTVLNYKKGDKTRMLFLSKRKKKDKKFTSV